MKPTLVITGGKGDIAQAIKKALQEEHRVLTPGKDELDVTDRINIKGYFKRNKPVLLINNAGYIKPEPIQQSSVDEWIQQVNVNLIGMYLCTREAIRNGCKMIVNIGSSAGSHGKPFWSAYCASKRAVVSFTESLDAEGITAVCISPGRTNTKMRHQLFPGEDPKGLMTPEEFAMAVRTILQRIRYLQGQDIIVKKENNQIVGYIYKKVKQYV